MAEMTPFWKLLVNTLIHKEDRRGWRGGGMGVLHSVCFLPQTANLPSAAGVEPSARQPYLAPE